MRRSYVDLSVLYIYVFTISEPKISRAPWYMASKVKHIQICYIFVDIYTIDLYVFYMDSQNVDRS